MYDNQRDAHMRLSETVMMYKGKPVFIIEVDNDLSFVYKELGDSNSKRGKHINELDFTPIRVGYTNYRGRAHFVTRLPIRKWKQGLSRQNLDLNGLDNRAMLSKAFHNMITKNYPSVSDCIDMVENDAVVSVSFSREFAIAERNILVYRGKGVGSVRNREMILSKQFFFLKEKLEMEMDR